MAISVRGRGCFGRGTKDGDPDDEQQDETGVSDDWTEVDVGIDDLGEDHVAGLEEQEGADDEGRGDERGTEAPHDL